MLLLPLLVACGDSLLSGTAVDQLLDDAPLPEAPAWRIRWLTGEGVYGDCALDEIDPEGIEAVFGEVELDAPDVEEPPVWNQGAGFEWALAWVTLVSEPDFTIETGPDLAIEEDGTWGLAESRAMLFVQGDLDAASDRLLAGDNGADLSEQGWVEWVPQLIALEGSPAGALLAVDDDDDDDELLVTHVERLSAAGEESVMGAWGQGLLTVPGCDQDAR